jgi:hypothetical protein
MAVFRVDATEFERLQNAIKNFPGDAEEIINEVLHTEGSQLIQESIKNLMPVSGRSWKGKKPAAKSAKSLTDMKGNLFVEVKTTSNYNYLYFPDDGTNTKKHAGNQQFFFKGAEAQQEAIIDLCINKLTTAFENK